MKVKLLLLFMCSQFVSSASLAQFHIGFKAGTNITKIDGQSFKDKFSYGYHLGGFAEINFPGTKFGIQPEVLWNQYSTRLDSNYKELYENVFNAGQSLKLNYLPIPSLLN